MSKKKPQRRSRKKKTGPLQATVYFFMKPALVIDNFVTSRKLFSSINIIGLFFILVTGVFVFRLYDLQVIHGAEYRERIDNQYTREETGNSIKRGDIFFSTKDGSHVLAATLRPLYTIAIDPRRIKDPLALYQEIESLLDISQASFLQKALKKNDPYEEIARKVEKSVVEELKKIQEPGLIFVLQNERFYPGDSLASVVLGFMSFSGDDLVGSYGLERYYDEILRRDTSVKTTSIFASLFSSDDQVQESNKTDIKKNIAKEGSLILTIEPSVQRFLESKLQQITNRWASKYSAGVIIDPDTGAIVAMATSDQFDLNTQTRHYRNYLIEDRLELGSIIKPLSVAVGLDSGAIDTDFSYNDKGLLEFEKFEIFNYDNVGRGPYTGLQTILTQSLNTGVATIALRTGAKTFTNYFYSLGFAEETGIDLPNEVFGLTSNLDSGRDVEIATASFGQGIAITPLEAVRALSTLANEGKLITPHVVDSIEYGDLIPSKNITINSEETVFSEEVIENVRDYMINIVDDSDTFRSYSNPNYSVAAKTGTAEIAKPTGGYYDDRFLHSFTGFFPAQANPGQQQYLVLLYTLEPKQVRFSSTTLKDPFFDIVDFMINYFDLIPDRFNEVKPLEQ